ncbi:hypothetical protein ACN28S_39385 [Cystobacter fuscus]
MAWASFTGSTGPGARPSSSPATWLTQPCSPLASTNTTPWGTVSRMAP